MSGSNPLAFGVPTLRSEAPVVADPVAAINAGNTAASGLYDLRAKQATAAWGNALAAATDENGNVDIPRAQALAAKDPLARQGMMAGLRDAAGLQTTQTTNINAQMNLRARAGLSMAVDPSDRNLASIRDELLANGAPAAQVETEYQRLLGMSEDERRRHAHRLAAVSLDHFTGTAKVEDTGSGFQPYLFRGVQAPGYGPQVPTLTPGGGSLGKGLTPADAASAVDLKLSDGTVIQVPLAQRNDILNRNPALRALNPDVAPSPGGGPWPPGGRPPPQDGQGQGGGQGGNTAPLPVPPVPPANPPPVVTAPVSPAPTQPPPVPTPQFQTSASRADAAAVRPPPQAGTTPPPAFVEQQKTGGANASRMEGEAQVARTQLQPLLQSMLPELEATGNTGAGQKTLSFLQQMAIRSGVAPPRFDPTNQQASSEALGKAMTRYQGAQLSALGTSPSDSRQSLAEGMSPSMGYSREGNRKIVHSLMGNNDALDTMYSAWMGSDTRRNNPGGFDQWREAFTKPVADGELKGARFDPTVFAVNRMPPAEQYRYLKDLQKASPGDYEQFKKNFALGQREGWVKPLGGG